MPEAPPAAIGIDLGGTQARVALVRGGAVVRRTAEPTDVAGGPEAVLGQFRRMIDAVCSRGGAARASAVGVCAPGPLDSESGVVLGIPTLPGWEDFPLAEALARELGLPVMLENDGIAAVYGEWKHGAGRGARNLVFVTGQHRHRRRRGGGRPAAARPPRHGGACRAFPHGAGRAALLLRRDRLLRGFRRRHSADQARARGERGRPAGSLAAVARSGRSRPATSSPGRAPGIRPAGR